MSWLLTSWIDIDIDEAFEDIDASNFEGEELLKSWSLEGCGLVNMNKMDERSGGEVDVWSQW